MRGAPARNAANASALNWRLRASVRSLMGTLHTRAAPITFAGPYQGGPDAVRCKPKAEGSEWP